MRPKASGALACDISCFFDQVRLVSLRDAAPVKCSHSIAPACRVHGGFVSMSALILLLVVAVVALSALRLWNVVLPLAVTSVVVVVLVGNGLLARWLAGTLQEPAFFKKPQEFAGVSAIVLLGDGSIVEPTTGEARPGWLAYSRIEQAASLYHSAIANGASCRIIVTGDDSADLALADRPVYAARLQALRVRATDVQVEIKGRNTYRQAELTNEILKGIQYDRIFIVTSGLHMKRALRYFLHFGVQAIPVASDYVAAKIAFLPSGANFAIVDIALHQYIGIARLRVYNALGWNR
jgi:uncharacterized SAM-binding protein YcdF (DUF218 family)